MPKPANLSDFFKTIDGRKVRRPLSSFGYASQKEKRKSLASVSERARSSMRRMSRDALRRSEDMRKGFLANRDLAIKTVNQQQLQAAERVARVQRAVLVANKSLKARAENIGLRKPVNQRIDLGLIGLERLIQQARDALMARDPSELMNLGPDIYKEIEAESRNIMKSKFFKTIIKQLKEEEDRA